MVRNGSSQSSLRRDYTTLAHEITVPSGLKNPLRRLLETTVIPHIQEGEKRTWRVSAGPTSVLGQMPTNSDSKRSGDLDGACEPLLHLGRESFVYGFCRRRSSAQPAGLIWILPPETREHTKWLKLFLQEVSEVDSDSVPAATAWATSSEWVPPALRNVVDSLKTLAEERERATAEFDAKEFRLERDLAELQSAAATGPQRLLTSDGQELVDAVRSALEDLGFSTQDMDDHHDEKTGAKLEDLRVTDTKDPDWICLAEVKGYLKGAKVSDVPQVTARPVISFLKESGHEPSSVWHTVNIWRGSDPSTRGKAIDNDAVDLLPLTQAEGALIDTRDLFRAWRDAQDQPELAEKIRASLKNARTRWTYEPEGLTE